MAFPQRNGNLTENRLLISTYRCQKTIKKKSIKYWRKENHLWRILYLTRLSFKKKIKTLSDIHIVGKFTHRPFFKELPKDLIQQEWKLTLNGEREDKKWWILPCKCLLNVFVGVMSFYYPNVRKSNQYSSSKPGNPLFIYQTQNHNIKFYEVSYI